jgi:NADPH-dependent curcumin reductase CurA
MLNMPLTSREVRLRSRPSGAASLENFEIGTVSVGDPAPGEVQIRNVWMSVDPYMRGRMNARKSYVPPFEVGRPLEGRAIGEVVASTVDHLKPGDLVSTMLGWRERFNTPAASIQPLQTWGLPPQAFLGVAGMPGLSAYVGLVRIGALKPGDVVFVSAAAGAVGSMACQIAKIHGNTVIGSAGGPEKIAYLKEIGVDHAIDYKAEADLAAALRRAAPNGIDLYFDNVGGSHLDAALASVNSLARVVLCGMIADYNAGDALAGIRNMGLAIGKSVRLESFFVRSHEDLEPEYLEKLSGWVKAGKIHWRESVDIGIENAPMSFLKLFSGESIGKMLVKLDR